MIRVPSAQRIRMGALITALPSDAEPDITRLELAVPGSALLPLPPPSLPPPQADNNAALNMRESLKSPEVSSGAGLKRMKPVCIF